MSTYLAVDIGGTHIRSALYGAEGLNPLKLKRVTTRMDTDDGLGNSPQDRLVNLIKSIWNAQQPPKAIGIAAPGPIDPFNRIILEAPNIPEWDNYPIGKEIEDAFDVPVLVGNDANLAALGEWKYGAGQGHHHLIYLTISTGIGGGIIIDDHLVVGKDGLASEPGHVTVLPNGPQCGCGKYGHLEAVASGIAIVNWVREQLQTGRQSSLETNDHLSAKDVSQAARNGDRLACEAIEYAAQFIGQALAGFIHITNPSIIILGGGVSQSGDLLFQPLRHSIEQHIMNPAFIEKLKIVPAAFGDESGLIGALTYAKSIKL